MNFSHDFAADLQTLMHEAEHGEPFAFVRFCDGEHAIMENRDIRTADGWKVGNEWMRKAMTEALTATLPRYFRGIACPCCWPQGAEWYREQLSKIYGYWNCGPVTYSNLFVNGNYDTALPWLRGLARNWCVVSSAWGSDIRVPADWSSIKDLESYVYAATSRISQMNRPTLVAAGPLGKVIIHDYWRRYSYRGTTPIGHPPTILDIGSALDPDFFGQGNRGYHDPDHPNRKKVCVWNTESPKQDLTPTPPMRQIVIRDVRLPG